MDWARTPPGLLAAILKPAPRLEYGPNLRVITKIGYNTNPE